MKTLRFLRTALCLYGGLYVSYRLTKLINSGEPNFFYRYLEMTIVWLSIGISGIVGFIQYVIEENETD